MDEVSIREIAGVANVNIASVNYHFRSKGDLSIEAVSQE